MDKFKDSKGALLTQSLIWDFRFDRERALYTVRDEDYDLEGRILPSLKKLYLECEDPTEYEFATTYFYSWKHWQRIVNNKMMAPHIEEWREELAIKLMSKGIKGVIEQSYTDKGYQAAKWLAEKGWVDKRVGRPTNTDVENERKQAARLKDQFADDFERVADYLQ